MARETFSELYQEFCRRIADGGHEVTQNRSRPTLARLYHEPDEQGHRRHDIRTVAKKAATPAGRPRAGLVEWDEI